MASVLLYLMERKTHMKHSSGKGTVSTVNSDGAGNIRKVMVKVIAALWSVNMPRTQGRTKVRAALCPMKELAML